MITLTVMLLVLGQGDTTSPPPEAPWDEGVSEEDRAFARTALVDGHLLMEQWLFGPALRTYEAGLARWAHPGLHHARARALLALKRTVDALHALWDARRYGGRGLMHVHRGALLLEHDLTRIQLALLVVDGLPEGALHLDGRPMDTRSGDWEGFVEAGTHTLVWPDHKGLVIEAKAGERVQVVASGRAPPSFSSRPLTQEDIDTFVARLPHPPMAPGKFDPGGVEGPPVGRYDVSALTSPLGRSEELAQACRLARGRAAKRCKEHEVAVAELERRIGVASGRLVALARKVRELTTGGIIDHLP